ncbi:MAG: hypothetical protein WD603_00335 [Patescibacteria group bacterium]
MSRKRLLLIAAAALLVLVALITVVFFGSEPDDEPGTTPASPTPDLSPSLPLDEDPHAGAFEEHQEEGDRNPVLSALPYGNDHWELTFNGSAGNKYKLLATVYYADGEDPSKKVSEQRPYVIEYLRKIGQPDGTYVIDYETRMVNSGGL